MEPRKFITDEDWREYNKLSEVDRLKDDIKYTQEQYELDTHTSLKVGLLIGFIIGWIFSQGYSEYPNNTIYILLGCTGLYFLNTLYKESSKNWRSTVKYIAIISVVFLYLYLVLRLTVYVGSHNFLVNTLIGFLGVVGIPCGIIYLVSLVGRKFFSKK